MTPPSPLPLHGLALTVTAHPLTPEAFAPFGEVVQNPRPDVHPSQFADAGPPPLPLDAVSANQGSAIKYQHVTHMVNHYGQAPSGVPGAAVMNMFVCAARKLSSSSPTSNSGGVVTGGGHDLGSRSGKTSPPSSATGYFEVSILERHPFTTQTFSPLSTTAAGGLTSDRRTHGYLVIVAPNQVPSSASTPGEKGRAPRNPPDLTKLKAFVATTNQAVTYGAGTWHAPMVALGAEGSTVDFVVTQFANGMGKEDCEEVTFGTGALGDGAIHVAVPPIFSQKPTSAKL